MTICPICNSEADKLFQKHGCWISECQGCGHRFVGIVPSPDHIQRVYGDHYFQGGGAGYPDYLSEKEAITARGKRYARLLSRYMRPGIVIDVGAAAGFILKGFVDSGWSGIGIEPNPRMADYACVHVGVRVETRTLEQFQNGDRYDLVSMIQVVAHFVDVRQAFQAAAEVTRSGGFWLIETWNRESLTARTLGKYWHEYSPPSVQHWFSPEGLQRLVLQFGFREVARGRPARWIKGRHAKSLLRYNLEGLRMGRLIVGMAEVKRTKRKPARAQLGGPSRSLRWRKQKLT